MPILDIEAKNRSGVTRPENTPTKQTLWERAKAFSIANAVLLGLVLSIVGILVGIVGILIGVWLYFAGQRNPLLKYGVWPVHPRIVRSESLGDLKVLYKGAEVHGDISIAFVIFQNDGATPIEGKDILEPIFIQLEGNAPILEASVQKKTRTVVKPSLQTEDNPGRLRVVWNILEHMDAFVVQITYIGSINTKLQVTGVIKGQQQGLQKQEEPSSIWTTTKEYNTTVFLRLATLVLISRSLSAFGMEVELYQFYRQKQKLELGPDKMRLVRKQFALHTIFLMAMSVTGVTFGILLWVGTQ